MKTPKKAMKRRSQSIDGIVTRVPKNSGFSAAKKPKTGGLLGQSPIRGEKQNIRPSLGEFKKQDGFIPNSRPHLGAQAFRSGEGMQSGRPNQQLEPNLNRKPKRHPDGTIDLNLPPDEIGHRKKRRFSWRFRKPTKKTAILTGLFILTGLGIIIGKGWYDISQILAGGGGSVLLGGTELRGEGDGRINILLLGKGGEGHEAPDLTDTILIASIDPINKQASLLSIPRDLWVTPEGGGSTKINAVYANAKYRVLNGADINNKEDEAEKAGLSAIEAEVSKDMGIPIHYHVMVDFAGFESAVNNVGGIDIDVSEENTVYENLWDPRAQQRYVLNVGTGPNHFDGRRALFYSRSRQTSQRGDFDRTERQRLVIEALKDKVLSLGTYSNPVKVSGLLDTFGNHVRSNFSLSEVMRLYEIVQTIPNDAIASLGLADPPKVLVTTDQIGGLSVVRPVAGVGNYSDIQSFVRNSLRDGFLASEDAKVYVYNGTTQAGLANEKADELKSFGYNVPFVGTAPTQNYQNTILVDLRDGQKKYTRLYLENRLGTTAITSLPDLKINAPDADFVIIVGQN